MRIISDFYDYYDSVGTYSQGANFKHEEFVYHRKSEEIVTERNDKTFKDFFHPRSSFLDRSYFGKREFGSDYTSCSMSVYIQIHPVSVLFCGVLYRGIQISESSSKVTFFSEKSATDYLESLGIDIFRGSDREFSTRFYKDPEFRSHTIKHSYLKTLFSVVSDQKFIDLAINLKSPIITIIEFSSQRIIVTKNGSLKAFDFYRVMDTYKTYQELDMFLGGILAPENKPIIKIEDKFRIAEHGFDKWSFRKQSQKGI